MLLSTAAYSAILQEFIEPIRHQEDTEEMFFQKCQIGQTAWNLCIAKEFGLSIYDEMSKIVILQNEKQPEMKPVFDFLIARKTLFFDVYKNFIFILEKRTKADGSTTIYVESMQAETIKQNTISQ
ncbi:MAG: hypothetical protein ABI675_21745 [Chitinophagaceae bacterium]